MKTIFFGTPRFGAIILEALVRAEVVPVLVVTAPDKPVGKKHELMPSPVKVVAEKQGIAVAQPSTLHEIPTEITAVAADLFVIAAYGLLLPKKLLELPQHGALNVHPSLLPKYRGASPVQTALLNGDTETGITIMRMDEQLDHGPLVAQKTTRITPEDTTETLSCRLAEEGARLLIETIPLWTTGSLQATPQDEKAASMTRTFTKDDGRLDWEKSAVELERQIRAFQPWPGTFTIWEKPDAEKVSLKILAGSPRQQGTEHYSTGTVFQNQQKEVCVQCGTDILQLELVQPAGKKPMNISDFLNGNPDFIGAHLL